MSVSLLVATDRPPIQKFIKRIVHDRYPGARVDTATNAPEFERKLARPEYDMILLDMNLPGLETGHGYRWPETQTSDGRSAMISRILASHETVVGGSSGSWAFVRMNAAKDKIFRRFCLAINKKREKMDGAAKAPKLTQAPLPVTEDGIPVHRELTPRQWEILTVLRKGQSNKEIARSLSILESTVKVHLKTIFRQLNVRNRTQAAIFAAQHDPRHPHSGRSPERSHDGLRSRTPRPSRETRRQGPISAEPGRMPPQAQAD